MEPNEKARIDKLRNATRYFYDLQKLRTQSSNRAAKKAEHAAAALDKHDKEFLKKTGQGLLALEKQALREVKRLERGLPIMRWMKAQPGCGPTMAGVLISEIDITRCNTPSALWAYCGLAPGQRRQRGQKAGYNPWLKSKVVFVLGNCLIKASSKNKKWKKFYDDYKHRKQHTMVPTCMACDGTGIAKYDDDAKGAKKPNEAQRADATEQPEEAERADAGQPPDAAKRAKKKKPCGQCNGTGGPAPWGRSDGHRSAAATRYMVKMFLLELWTTWRELEGLEVTPPYSEAVLGRTHGDHGGMGKKLNGARGGARIQASP